MMKNKTINMILLFNDPNCKVFFSAIGRTMVFLIDTALGTRIITDFLLSEEGKTSLKQQLTWITNLKIVVKSDMAKEWMPYSWKDGNLIFDPIVYSDVYSDLFEDA